MTGRKRDGSEFPLALAVSEGWLGGRRVFTGIARDLSDRDALRQAQERAAAAEKLASIATLTAGIAHDIGTPMNVILGYASMLESALEDERQRKRAHRIVEATQRVTDLIQTLLNISRPREAHRVPLALDAVIDHALDFLKEKLEKRRIVTVRELDAVPLVQADRDQIEQVFLNLIVNAADAMPDGGRLTIQLSSATPDEVLVRVCDTGTGIAAEDAQRVFEPFYTTKERGQGNGLGLLVSRSIVMEHGGTIELESEPGRGTEVRIRLPTVSSR